MTKNAGITIHGICDRLRTFCVSLSMTPQLVIGGLSPRPKKPRAVSLRIIDGMASVAWTIRWLAQLGKSALD